MGEFLGLGGFGALEGWPWNDEKFWINHICDMWSIKLRKFIILKQTHSKTILESYESESKASERGFSS